MTISEFADQLGYYSILLPWFALIIRARPAWKDSQQRGLWLAILAAAIATTLFQRGIVNWAVEATGDSHAVTLSRNLTGVLAAGLTLYFIVDSTGGRRQRIITTIGLMATLATLLAMDLAKGDYPGPVLPPSTGPAAPSSVYWLILCGSHLVADTVAAIICWRYSRRTGDRDLMWSLRVFAIGSILAIWYWVALLVHLYARMPEALPYTSVIIDIHAASRGLTLLVPIATHAARLTRDARTVWVLWPMWRDLSAAVPNITLIQPQPTRLHEFLRPRAPLALQAHRQTIETYDAILDLQSLVSPQAYQHALGHAQRIHIPTTQATAAALAGALAQARRAKLAGQPAASEPQPLPGLDRGDTALLMAIARNWPTMSHALPGNEPITTTS